MLTQRDLNSYFFPGLTTASPPEWPGPGTRSPASHKEKPSGDADRQKLKHHNSKGGEKKKNPETHADDSHTRARVRFCASVLSRCFCCPSESNLHAAAMETSDGERDPRVTSAFIVFTQAGNVLMGTAAKARTSASVNKRSR